MASPAPSDLRRFAMLRRDVEAVLQPIGRDMWDFLLVDLDGDWVRAVVPSKAAGDAIARDLGVRLHRGWDDPRIARRVGKRDDWSRSRGRRRAL